MTRERSTTIRVSARRYEQEEARQRLRAMLLPGATVYGHVMHVSSSGMSRVIRLEIPTLDERTGRLEIWDITGLVARALGERVVDRPCWGLRVGGCGMDMVFATISNLSYALHGFGRETDSPEQVQARTGPLAPGTPGHPLTSGSECKDGEGARRPGYTLQQGRA